MQSSTLPSCMRCPQPLVHFFSCVLHERSPISFQRSVRDVFSTLVSAYWLNFSVGVPSPHSVSQRNKIHDLRGVFRAMDHFLKLPQAREPSADISNFLSLFIFFRSFSSVINKRWSQRSPIACASILLITSVQWSSILCPGKYPKSIKREEEQVPFELF